ncbi:MAG: hypothetical protein O7G85_12975 [Planctomycetota bacterium]|nr:hypothetical protein [Planctomycetota bacterium]
MIVIAKQFALCFFFTTMASAQPVRDIHVMNTNPIAVRGGPLLMSLTSTQPGDHWPSVLHLTLDDNRTIEGHVIWMQRITDSAQVHWTDDPRHLLVRSVRPDDDSSALVLGVQAGPYLALRLPIGFEGDLRLTQQVITPRWIDPPSTMGTSDPSLPTLPAGPAPDLPDAQSPLEFWRWTLMAQRLGVNHPDLHFTDLETIVAQYYAALWGWGLDRLHHTEPMLANQCILALTQVGRDRKRPFAIWEADPRRLNELLGILIGESLRLAQRDEQVRNWLEQREPLLMWTEAEDPLKVRMVMVNRTRETIIPRFTWIHTRDIPSVAQIESGVLTQVRIDRAETPDAGPLRTAQPIRFDSHILLIEADQRQYRMDFTPESIEVRPPGVAFPLFHPPLTLGDIQTRIAPSMSADRMTMVQLRRLDHRWELFFECRRPLESAPSRLAPPSSPLATIAKLDEVRHVESITLLIGPEADEQGPFVALTIPEIGPWKFFAGATDDTMEIHRRTWGDRWYCRVVLPDRWLIPTQGPMTLLGARRSHARTDQIETSPRAGTSWRINSGRMAVDLSPWTDEPEFENASGSFDD